MLPSSISLDAIGVELLLLGIEIAPSPCVHSVRQVKVRTNKEEE